VTRHVGTGPVVNIVARHPVHTGRIGIIVSRSHTRQGKKVNNKVLVIGAANCRINTGHDTVTLVTVCIVTIGIGVGRVAALDARIPAGKW
jgi:hypothetical protein